MKRNKKASEIGFFTLVLICFIQLILIFLRAFSIITISWWIVFAPILFLGALFLILGMQKNN